MKGLINFINEVHRKDYKNIKDELYTNYSYKYFEYLNNNDELQKVIEKAFNQDIGDVLKIMNDNHISNFIDKKIIPRIIEYYLANNMSNINGFIFKHINNMSNINGFIFKQGEENSENKDIFCKTINDKILE